MDEQLRLKAEEALKDFGYLYDLDKEFAERVARHVVKWMTEKAKEEMSEYTQAYQKRQSEVVAELYAELKSLREECERLKAELREQDVIVSGITYVNQENYTLRELLEEAKQTFVKLDNGWTCGWRYVSGDMIELIRKFLKRIEEQLNPK